MSCPSCSQPINYRSVEISGETVHTDCLPEFLDSLLRDKPETEKKLRRRAEDLLRKNRYHMLDVIANLISGDAIKFRDLL